MTWSHALAMVSSNRRCPKIWVLPLRSETCAWNRP